MIVPLRIVPLSMLFLSAAIYPINFSLAGLRPIDFLFIVTFFLSLPFINVKIDNLVHISHGVIIGANSLIIANSMIAGSSIIGEDVWISPSSSILNKKCIGNNSVIGMGAVVLKDVKEGQIIIGNPGKELIKK